MVEYLNFSIAVLGSLGIGGGIVFGLSSWLGKVWAQRILSAEKMQNEKEIEALRNDLTSKSKEISILLGEASDIRKEMKVRGFNDRMAIYRLGVDLISDALSSIDHVLATDKNTVPHEFVREFNNKRMKAYGYISMLAPQEVIDAFDRLVDYLFEVLHGESNYQWPKVRELVLDLLNEIRRDIGLSEGNLVYKGNR